MSKKIIQVSGKRKHSIARATVREGKGIVRVNRMLLEQYEPEMYRMKIKEPLLLAGDEMVSKVNIDVKVSGGGINSGAEAVRLAIARGLVEYVGRGPLREKFLAYDRNMLVADIRRNEPHKPGDSKARARRQKSYR